MRLVRPESEADPHALLLPLLVGFGAMVGRKPHYLVESTRQAINEYVVIVGETAKGRKGTAVDRALNVLSQVDPEFMESRVPTRALSRTVVGKRHIRLGTCCDLVV